MSGIRQEAIEIIQSMIEQIIVTPVEGNRPAIPTYRVSKAAVTLDAERNSTA